MTNILITFLLCFFVLKVNATNHLDFPDISLKYTDHRPTTTSAFNSDESKFAIAMDYCGVNTKIFIVTGLRENFVGAPQMTSNDADSGSIRSLSFSDVDDQSFDLKGEKLAA